jgi:hypothetical protein
VGANVYIAGGRWCNASLLKIRRLDIIKQDIFHAVSTKLLKFLTVARY